MTSHREKYLKVEQERHDLVTSLAGLPDEVQREKDAIKPIEDEVIRREILGEEAGSLIKELEGRREKIRRMTRKHEEDTNRARVMLAVLQDLRAKADADMTEPAVRRFLAGVKDLLKKIEEARQVEAALAALQEKIREEFDEIGSRCPVDRWETVIIRSMGDPTPKVNVANFIEQMKARGYNV